MNRVHTGSLVVSDQSNLPLVVFMVKSSELELFISKIKCRVAATFCSTSVLESVSHVYLEKIRVYRLEEAVIAHRQRKGSLVSPATQH
jgi:hypothetical protein